MYLPALSFSTFLRNILIPVTLLFCLSSEHLLFYLPSEHLYTYRLSYCDTFFYLQPPFLHFLTQQLFCMGCCFV
ncbi:hypothetical protein F5Y06DRAFT_282536 [Hypoxylon sp. FL0890]|nr:hypothetical protein F5Y06DRAFT_282536 [Hypoxylon sp. FL0890]